MKPPRDPSAPSEGQDNNRHSTGTFMIREYTPIEPMPSPPPIPQPEKKSPSIGFITALSVILGIILTASAIIGGLGRAFFVTRDEYAKQEMVYTSEKTDLQKTLTKLESAVSVQSMTLEKQDVTLQRLVDKVQTVREDMARRGR